MVERSGTDREATLNGVDMPILGMAMLGKLDTVDVPGDSLVPAALALQAQKLADVHSPHPSPPGPPPKSSSPPPNPISISGDGEGKIFGLTSSSS